VAGVEAALLLKARLFGQVDVRLVLEDDYFQLRPNLVYLPFGADSASSGIYLEGGLDRAEIAYEKGHVEGLDTDAGQVELAGGGRRSYEHLVIATGASPRPGEVPGLEEHAVSIWDAAGMLTLRERFMHLRGEAREGVQRRVLFVVPQHNQCSLPLYEVALMLDTWLRREDARERVDIGFVTHEASFAEAGGPRVHELFEGEFAERGIAGRAAERATEVSPHEVSFADGHTEDFDLLVTIPAHAQPVRYDGLPVDERGFLRVESASRQVQGHPELYAPGGAGDFPLKDTFLSLLEADAVGDHLVATITGGEFKRPFDAVTMNVIDMLDRAAFAQVPLEATGDPDHPVGLRSGAEDDYKVGVSPAWRGGKRLFASYLLMRFSAGEPFRAGVGWRLMDVGVRAMSGMLAD
jgi:sulfide:quinone oxidoreductase